MADRRFRAMVSRMTVAEMVLCGSRVPVFFIKHPFIFGLFNTPRPGYRGLVQTHSELEVSCKGDHRGCRVVTARIRTRRHATLLSARDAFTDGICGAALSVESQLDSLPGGQDYKPAQVYVVDISFDSAAGQRGAKFYSQRRATVGSTRVARRAGI